MADFKVGDLVKKNRGVNHIGHQGWVKAVFTTGTPPAPGLSDRGTSNNDPDGYPCAPRKYNGWNPVSWDKVVLTGKDRSVSDKAPQHDEEMA